MPHDNKPPPKNQKLRKKEKRDSSKNYFGFHAGETTHQYIGIRKRNDYDTKRYPIGMGKGRKPHVPKPRPRPDREFRRNPKQKDG